MDGRCQNADELFKALEQCKDDLVIDICSKNVDRGLSVCSIHNATVLHLAISNPKLFKLANKLLDDLLGSNNENQEGVSKLSKCEDAWGNTLLHCAATTDNVGLARRLCKIAPDMLFKHKWGETAFFQACRYVNFGVFKYLSKKADEFHQTHAGFDMRYFFKRKDNMNVLHVSIVMRAFDIAIFIAKKYPDLCKERAQDEMTALQVLASSPTVFPNKHPLGFFDQIIYTCVSTCANDVVNTDNERCINTKINEMKRLKKQHERVLELSTILINNEGFWRITYKPAGDDTIAILANNKQTKGEENKTTALKNQTALQMAVKNGITEIVEKMLEICPAAVEQFNKEKQNLLHIAIKYRRIEIFDIIQKKHASSFEWLNRNIDVDGNTILHMVGSNIEDDVIDKDKNPAKQLSEGLKLLTRLKKLCPPILSHHINNDKETADQKFETNNKELHERAKKWLENTAKNSTVVIVLIATVAFTAAYTVPGGPDQKTGAPVLLGNPFFLVFTMTDVLSLAFGLTAVVLFLLILTSSFKLNKFRNSLPTTLILGFTFVLLSVTMMMVSFASTIILTIHNNKKQWTRIAVYAATFFPVAILVSFFIPLYLDFVGIQIGNRLLSFLRYITSRFACPSSCKHTQQPLLCICSVEVQPQPRPQPQPDQPHHTHDV